MISDYIKAKLASEIPGILTATAHLEGGKQVVRINGATATVGPFASDNEIEAAIRLALNVPKQEAAPVADEIDQAAPEAAEPVRVTELPPAPVLVDPAPVAAPAPRAPAKGGFAASLKALMDDARAGVAKAREDGTAQVQSAVAELHQAKAAVAHVTGKMAQTIKDEVADIRGELSQISNDLGE